MDWIVTENIYQESWRRILEFANIDLAIDEIAKVHGKPTTKGMKSNYKKQAKQVRVSVLQAKEFFDAAAASSIFTSANHIYYGMISLATAIMLIRGDGTKSLDVLRRDSSNNHHGLDFSTGCTLSRAGSNIELLKTSYVKILKRGHFFNWYSTLPTREELPHYLTTQTEGTTSTHRGYYGGYTTANMNELAGRKLTCLELLKYLPDLHGHLLRCGIKLSTSRMTHTETRGADGNTKHVWILHGAGSKKSLDDLLEFFKIESSYIDSIDAKIDDEANGALITVHIKNNQVFYFCWPSTREKIDNEVLAYAHEINTSEFVDSYLISYQLSMLSRYYPDLWISCLESQCRAAKLIEATIDTLRNKVPMLALSKLRSENIIISNHRPPWIGM